MHHKWDVVCSAVNINFREKGVVAFNFFPQNQVICYVNGTFCCIIVTFQMVAMEILSFSVFSHFV